jgi:hypothetical protein
VADRVSPHPPTATRHGTPSRAEIVENVFDVVAVTVMTRCRTPGQIVGIGAVQLTGPLIGAVSLAQKHDRDTETVDGVTLLALLAVTSIGPVTGSLCTRSYAPACAAARAALVSAIEV